MLNLVLVLRGAGPGSGELWNGPVCLIVTGSVSPPQRTGVLSGALQDTGEAISPTRSAA